jgi:hypothetical protein
MITLGIRLSVLALVVSPSNRIRVKKTIIRNTVQLSLVLFALLVLSSTARAQGVIRFIASYGSDSYPCTRTLPCRTM